MENKSEQLLRPCEVYKKLRISKSTYYRVLPRLLANGLKQVWVNGMPKYLDSSIDEMIRKAVRTGRPLC